MRKTRQKDPVELNHLDGTARFGRGFGSTLTFESHWAKESRPVILRLTVSQAQNLRDELMHALRQVQREEGHEVAG